MARYYIFYTVRATIKIGNRDFFFLFLLSKSAARVGNLTARHAGVIKHGALVCKRITIHIYVYYTLYIYDDYYE